MFNLPNIARLRFYSLVFGFLCLFFFIGFCKWAFADYYSLNIVSRTHSCVGWGKSDSIFNAIKFDVCTGEIIGWNREYGEYGDSCGLSVAYVPPAWGGYVPPDNSDTAEYFDYTITHWSGTSSVTSPVIHSSVGGVLRGWGVMNLNGTNCGACSGAGYSALIEPCGGAQNVVWNAVTCTGHCKTCAQVGAELRQCDPTSTMFWHCQDDGSQAPDHLDFTGPADGVCRNCPTLQDQFYIGTCVQEGKDLASFDCEHDTGVCCEPGDTSPACNPCQAERAIWEQSCSGPDKYPVSYNCETHQGNCRDCLTAKQAWNDKVCKPKGKVVVSYDCSVDAGICGDDTCEQDKADWAAANNCTGSDKSVYDFNCDTKQGHCRDENDCPSKQAAWVAKSCTQPGQQLLDYDCQTDTGHCTDPNKCEDKKAAFVAKYCTPENKELDSYDCQTDTGKCKTPTECPERSSKWQKSYCAGETDVFMGFDCATGEGKCLSGTDYKAPTPKDEDKGKIVDLTNKFLTDMKTTGLFSLPNQVLGSIPSGGNPVFEVPMGRYGNGQVDLSQYASLLNVLRVVFLICFSFAALRIVISHK